MNLFKKPFDFERRCIKTVIQYFWRLNHMINSVSSFSDINFGFKPSLFLYSEIPAYIPSITGKGREEDREEGKKEGREEERKNTKAALKRAEAAERRIFFRQALNPRYRNCDMHGICHILEIFRLKSGILKEGSAPGRIPPFSASFQCQLKTRFLLFSAPHGQLSFFPFSPLPGE